MCIETIKSWCYSKDRKELWLKLDKDVNVDTYLRMIKQYELISILSGLVTGTFGMILDNKNIKNEYKSVYSVFAGLGLLFSLSTVLISLSITTLLGVIRQRDVSKFVEKFSHFFSPPVIFLLLGISSMFTCIVMYFGSPVCWILLPFALVTYCYCLWIYCCIRSEIIKWE
jgi:hypothetical protein